MMYNKVYENSMEKKTRVINKVVLICGVVGGLCGFGYSIYELISPAESDWYCIGFNLYN